MVVLACQERRANSFKSVDGSYVFEGSIKGMDSGWLYIGHPDTNGNEYSYLDSSRIINSTFKFAGKISDPEPCVFVFKNGPNSIHITSSFILDQGDLNGVLFKDSMERSRITGIETQDQYQRFLSAYIGKRDSNFMLRSKLYEHPDDTASMKLLEKNITDQVGLFRQIINQNPNSLVSAFILSKYMPEGMKTTDLEALYTILQNRNNFYARNIFQALRVKKQTDIGRTAPPFEIKTQHGNTLTNLDFKGKTVLLDFWASWCIPCRAQNPSLLKAYDAYKPKGFTIVSISLDQDSLSWINAVKQDKLPWDQVCDFQVLQSPMVKSYGIKTIPMNFLIDSTGRIVAKNLRDDEILNTVWKHIN